jgi:alkylation response protein AidB-like acyl-CoA dehydrogenase
MDNLRSPKLRELRDRADVIAREVAAPVATEVDRNAMWPEHTMRAMADAGLMGLHVHRVLGGEGQGLLGLVAVTEAVGMACSSSALCYGMHCVGTAVIAARSTAYQRERYLEPIAAGEHITSLGLSESGMGSHVYLSETALRRDDGHFVVDGVKQFITNGGRADSYVVSTMSSRHEEEPGEFSVLIVDEGTPGISWLPAWDGLGMRGNSSRGLRLDAARVPVQNLLGEEGDQIWYLFDVVVPYFLVAMSATYLAIARAALDYTIQHMRTRRYSHSGESLAEVPVLQHKLAGMWVSVEKTRRLVYAAARLGDAADADALPAILMSKADVAETAVAVTNEAMTICGGIAYRENAHLARLLRDARASHVMSPTTDMLKQWAARSMLGLPLL